MLRVLIGTTTILMALVGAASAGTLDSVKQRGMLNCGVSPGLAGFSLPDKQGNWTGLDVDYCRAIAAAVFNDPNKVRFVPTTSTARFTALQAGEVDLLARDTTYTLSRDTSAGGNFAAINFYDGEAFMVHRSMNISAVKELDGATICVQQGSTDELEVADYFRAHKLNYKIVTFATSAETAKAYESGRCDAYATDASGLYAQRLAFSAPDEHVVLADIISKEPLASMVRHGDDQWYDIVKWVHFAMVTAEEDDVTKANVDEKAKSDDPELKRLLGTEGKFGESLGLTNDWAYRIIKQVGNYGEIFDHDVGAASALKIARGQNALWNKGGLQYAPPIR